MLILAFESSAKSASAALVKDGKLLAQTTQISALTHSRTLLPMAEDLLKNCHAVRSFFFWGIIPLPDSLRKVQICAKMHSV